MLSDNVTSLLGIEFVERAKRGYISCSVPN